jgi:hypothetical protein
VSAWVQFAAFGQPSQGPAWITLAIGILGLGGLVFTALRFRRDDTTAIVSQQDTILSDMKALNEEFRQAAVAMRAERDDLKNQVGRLTEEVAKLREELERGRLDA